MYIEYRKVILVDISFMGLAWLGLVWDDYCSGTRYVHTHIHCPTTRLPDSIQLEQFIVLEHGASTTILDLFEIHVDHVLSCRATEWVRQVVRECNRETQRDTQRESAR